MSDTVADYGRVGRTVAAIIALIALAGIVLYALAQMGKGSTLSETLWVLARFFTILSNVLVLVVCAMIAVGVRVTPRFVAGTALAIVLVGVVYELLLSGLNTDLTGGSAAANTLLHRVTPLVVPFFWLIFVPKGTLRFTDTLLWAAFPVAYLAYAMIRGNAEGIYAYPFLDIGANGATQVVITVVVIALGFLASGVALVGIDRWLSIRR
jgi:hypothetical protein